MNTDLLNPSFFIYSLGKHSKLYVFIALFFGMGMAVTLGLGFIQTRFMICLLYTSDAADDLLCVDLGGRRIIKKTIHDQH